MPRMMAGVLTALIAVAALMPGPRRTVAEAVEQARPAVQAVTVAAAGPAHQVEWTLRTAVLFVRNFCLPERMR